MIEVVINYDENNKVFKVYEPTTDTLLITASITESFVKLSEFLQSKGMIPMDILNSKEVSYHIDSPTFIAMVESNVNLLKRLNSAPSGFTISSQKFGVSNYKPSVSSQLAAKKNAGQGFSNSLGKNTSRKSRGKKFGSSAGSSGMFSKSAFRSSNKKFGGM